MLLFVFGLIALVAVGCSSSHRTYGTITGRYYSDGWPPPPSPPTPIAGTITITNKESHKTYQPHQDSDGYFTVVVPVGTYDVMADAHGVPDAITTTLTVTRGNADLGIHLP